VTKLPVYGYDSTENDEYRSNSSTRATVHGGNLFLSPQNSEAVTVQIDGIHWATNYSGSSDEDWMLENGHDFLFWRAVVELNHVTKNFVYRQEGNLMPPEKLADMAYATLVQLDSDITDGTAHQELS
jgi:hypothetical protein